MTLIFSDLHLGRSPEHDPDMIRDLESCVESHNGVREVIILGDLFDAYLEYPGSIPMVVETIMPLFRTFQERGIEIHYHVGNHDLWHLDYFLSQVGVQLHIKPVRRTLFDARVFFSHGDEEDPGEGLSRLVHVIIRHPFSYRLYRTILPARWGQALPKWVSRRFASSESKPTTVRSLRKAAESILKSDDVDVVVFGHSHRATKIDTQHGTYVNTGSWWIERSFAGIDTSGIRLDRWRTGE